MAKRLCTRRPSCVVRKYAVGLMMKRQQLHNFITTLVTNMYTFSIYVHKSPSCECCSDRFHLHESHNVVNKRYSYHQSTTYHFLLSNPLALKCLKGDRAASYPIRIMLLDHTRLWYTPALGSFNSVIFSSSPRSGSRQDSDFYRPFPNVLPKIPRENHGALKKRTCLTRARKHVVLIIIQEQRLVTSSRWSFDSLFMHAVRCCL